MPGPSDDDILEQAELERVADELGDRFAADPTAENLQAHNRAQAELVAHRSRIAVEQFGPNGGMSVIAEHN